MPGFISLIWGVGGGWGFLAPPTPPAARLQPAAFLPAPCFDSAPRYSNVDPTRTNPSTDLLARHTRTAVAARDPPEPKEPHFGPSAPAPEVAPVRPWQLPEAIDQAGRRSSGETQERERFVPTCPDLAMSFGTDSIAGPSSLLALLRYVRIQPARPPSHPIRDLQPPPPRSPTNLPQPPPSFASPSNSTSTVPGSTCERPPIRVGRPVPLVTHWRPTSTPIQRRSGGVARQTRRG